MDKNYADTVLQTRVRVKRELQKRLTDRQRQFLSGLVRAKPDGSLLEHQHAAELPALRWKLANLEAFRTHWPVDFAAQAEALEAKLHQTKAPSQQ